MKERISDAARRLFYTYGSRSITMNEIATELGISKKTIYQHFADKSEIIEYILMTELECTIDDTHQMNKTSGDPIEEALMYLEFIRKWFSQMSPIFVSDLRKFYPNIWHKLIHTHEKHHLNTIRQSLIEGIELGVFRPEIDVEILPILRYEQIKLGMDQNVFQPEKFNSYQVQKEILYLFLRGIVTEKGLKIFTDHLNNKYSLEQETP